MSSYGIGDCADGRRPGRLRRLSVAVTLPRSALLAFLTAAVALVALPAGADATEGLTVSPSSVHAGAHPTLDVNLQFAPEANDSARTAVVALAPGMLLNLGARPACLTGAIDPTPTCEIGTSSARLRVVGTPARFSGKLYLIPPPGTGDIAGLLIDASPVYQPIGIALRREPTVGLNLDFQVGNNPSAAALNYDLHVNETFNDRPLVSVPTSCGSAISTLNVTYYRATPPTTASSSFTPTACGSLPYAPRCRCGRPRIRATPASRSRPPSTKTSVRPSAARLR